MHRKKRLEASVQESIIRKYQAERGPKQITLDLDLNTNTFTSVIRLFNNPERTLTIQQRRQRKKRINADAHIAISDVINTDTSVSLRASQQKLKDELQILATMATISRSLTESDYTIMRVTLGPSSRSTPETIDVRRR